MKGTQRLISGALSLAIACSLCVAGVPAAAAAGAEAETGQSWQLTGSIGLTIRFDLPQTAENVAGRNLQLTVSGGGKRTVVSLPGGASSENGLGAGVSVAVKNVDGVALTNETRVGYYQVELSGLPAGETYELSLTGTGYVPFTQRVTLDGYSHHVIVGTGDGTFSLGDVNGNNTVGQEDLTAMDGQLGKKAAAAYDLNGDGVVDVTDLSYINYTLGVTGDARVLDTAAILPAQLDTSNLTVTGDPDGLFRDEGTVTIAPAEGSALELPVVLSDSGVEISQLQIACPDGEGAIQTGTVTAELADGKSLTVPFDISLPEGVHAIGETEGQRVVTVDLGKKVAVKKVTITVTKVAGQNGAPQFAAVTRIEFLKDIVPANPQNDADQVKGVTAVPGDGQVALSWNAVRNITGYTVAYGTAENALNQSVSVNTNRAVVSGLDNFKTCYFQVTAVNGAWKGTPSGVISAVPEPKSIPGAPSNIGVTAADQALRLSWGKTKDASYYQVFYRVAGQSAFTQFGGNVDGTSVTITGLTNGTTYEVAVKAGNSKGVGPYSATASGTPKKETIELPELPVEDRIDSSMIQSVVMENPGNVNGSLCPNFTTADVIDNDAATYWIANQWWVSSKFTYTFKEPQDMNYAILVPYLGGNYKYALSSYTVTARDSGGNTILAQTLYSAPRMDGEKNYLVLTFPMLEGVKELSISLNEREGNGCRVSISEMAFYKSDSLAADIAALFTDGSFIALQSGVTAETISALSARLEARKDFYLDLARLRDELTLAEGLLNHNQTALGVVKADFQSRSGAQDSSYGQSASDLQPLGVSARAGATVAVYAVLPDDAPVYVVPTQFYGESGIWRGTPVQLVNGRNYIKVQEIGSLTDERGGAFYLTYGGAHPEQIRVQVRGDSNTFAVPVLELSGWYGIDEAARKDAIRAYVTGLQDYVDGLNLSAPATDVRNVTEISTPSVLLSIPANQALNGLKGVNASTENMVETLYQNVLAWEDELYVANQVQGILDAAGARGDEYRYPMTTRQNIRYMRMFAGAFMYAAGNHIGVGYGSTTGLMCGRPVSATGTGNTNGLFGWGIAHEIGHNMDKLGKAEITNNIYALAMQAWDGGSMTQNTRLTASKIWPAIYAKTSAGQPGTASNVFVQLGMYWQLHLAYDSGDKPLDFYNQFFRLWKAGEYSTYSYDERVALIAARVVGRNLTQFFTHWGMTLGNDVQKLLAEYPAEPRAIWYLNDDSYAYRLNSGAAFAGTVTVTAAVDENTVTLTIEGGDAAVLGYEIRRNGRAVAFTTENTYTDNLGAANNLTYTYTVVPVDRLGNAGEPSKPVETRVAYDKTISANLYTVVREGTTVTITMKEGAVPVTGVRVTGTGLSGDYTAEVKAEAGAEKWATARKGTLSGDVVVDYFTKPGADSGDARLWTYDAAVVKLTGIPAGAEVALLDYPGDRVDLYEGTWAGLLQSDYRYGEEKDDVIPAGTLIIMGAYRGDPVYNTVEVQARYDTTAEAQEGNHDSETGGVRYVERAMSGYALLFAELPKDGAVSDTSNGFWIFVPNLKAETELNKELGITDSEPVAPAEVRVVFYRTNNPNSSDSRRVTSETLWASFPELDTLPQIELKGA